MPPSSSLPITPNARKIHHPYLDSPSLGDRRTKTRQSPKSIMLSASRDVALSASNKSASLSRHQVRLNYAVQMFEESGDVAGVEYEDEGPHSAVGHIEEVVDSDSDGGHTKGKLEPPKKSVRSQPKQTAKGTPKPGTVSGDDGDDEGWNGPWKFTSPKKSSPKVAKPVNKSPPARLAAPKTSTPKNNRKESGLSLRKRDDDIVSSGPLEAQKYAASSNDLSVTTHGRWSHTTNDGKIDVVMKQEIVMSRRSIDVSRKNVSRS